MTPWSLALLFLLCGWPLERNTAIVAFLGALAEESTPPADGAAGAPESTPPADGAAGTPEQQSAPPAQEAQDEAASDASPPLSFADSAKELREKLGQLKSLLDKRGDGGDPALKERLEGLTKQLSSLGLDGLDGLADSKKSAEKQVITACITMAIKHVGLKRSAALSSLKRLASGNMKPKEASEDQLVRTVVVCLDGLSDTEYKQYTAGKLNTLPKALADKAATSASKAEVLALEVEFPGIWEQLASAAGPVYESLKEAAAKEAPPPVAIRYGLLAGAPILLAVAFLGKKFVDLQRDLRLKEELKKEKAAKKKGK